MSRFRRMFKCSLPKCHNFRFPAMEKPESSTGDESNVELEDRDPNSLNKHLQVCYHYDKIYIILFILVRSLLLRFSILVPRSLEHQLKEYEYE